MPDLADAERRLTFSDPVAPLKLYLFVCFCLFPYNITIGGVPFVLCAFSTREFVQIDENKKVNKKY